MKPGRLALLIGVLATTAGGVWLLHPAPGTVLPAASQHLPFVALLAAFLGAEMLVVRFWFRGDTHNFSLAGVPLLLGLTFASPLATLAARLAGTAIAAGIRRSPVDKSAFNLSLVALETGVAATAFHHVLGSTSPVSPGGWLAGAVAVLVADVTSHLGVLGVIRLTGGPVSRAALATLVEVGAAVVATTVVLSLVATMVLWVDARAGLLLVVIVAVAALAYRAYGALRGRYAGLEVLYRFTDALAPVEHRADVAAAALRQACELLRARRAELALYDGVSYLVSRHVDGATSVERLFEPPASLALAIEGGAASLVDGATMVAPLRSGGEVVGAMTVGDRQRGEVAFDGDDLRVFVALVNHASVAFRNGELLEEVRTQADQSLYRALHDELTGLGNRAHLVAEVDRLLAEQEPGTKLAVMLMDLDGFKEVNDTLGHHVGDAVLEQVASALATIENEAIVARLGGDEFAVAFASLPDVEAARALAHVVAGIVQQPVVADVAIDVRVSVGVALAPEHGGSLSELLRKADIAMYTAKSARSGVEVYNSDEDTYSARRLSLAGELRGDILGDRLDLHHQPKIDLATGRVVGVEALARWPHASYGMVPPDEFIPVAEASGLMHPLTMWVLDRALRDLNSWGAAASDLSVAVNVSARSLVDARLCDEVRDALDRHGVAASRLTIEITESSLMTQLDRTLGVLDGLAEMGVRLSVDDFGTGYSSLAQLKGLPVHEVKIDKSFVIGMWQDRTDAAIIEVILQLANKLNLDVVAEGIEDVETFNWLRSLGCRSGQGYHVARPMVASAMPEWLATWHRPAIDALVVDDQRSFRVAMRLALADDGITVIAEAEDGRHAVEQAARFQPRVILLDVGMPRLSGFDALPLIRSAAPSATVVVVSAADDELAERRSLDGGAVAFLDKHIGPDAISARIWRLIADGGQAVEVSVGGLGSVPTAS